MATESSMLPSSMTMSSHVSRGSSLWLSISSMRGSTSCPFLTGTMIGEIRAVGGHRARLRVSDPRTERAPARRPMRTRKRALPQASSVPARAQIVAVESRQQRGIVERSERRESCGHGKAKLARHDVVRRRADSPVRIRERRRLHAELARQTSLEADDLALGARADRACRARGACRYARRGRRRPRRAAPAHPSPSRGNTGIPASPRPRQRFVVPTASVTTKSVAGRP